MASKNKEANRRLQEKTMQGAVLASEQMTVGNNSMDFTISAIALVKHLDEFVC